MAQRSSHVQGVSLVQPPYIIIDVYDVIIRREVPDRINFVPRNFRTYQAAPYVGSSFRFGPATLFLEAGFTGHPVHSRRRAVIGCDARFKVRGQCVFKVSEKWKILTKSHCASERAWRFYIKSIGLRRARRSDRPIVRDVASISRR